MVEYLLPKVRDVFETEAEVVKSYHNKDSFGDMDIIVLNDGNQWIHTIKDTLEEFFKPNEIHHNGNCWSFDYEELQIDLILTPEKNWETSKVFFAYNDLGNLMGKLYHKFGLKYGYDGVKYVYRIDDKKLGDITVAKDMSKAFDFLGLSWKKFEEGFNDIEDIFEYVISSPYFVKEAFYLENLNAINRHRNKRRKVYNLFINYVNGIGEYKGKEALPDKPFIFEKDKSIYFEKINEFFPEANFFDSMKALKEKEKIKREVASKFNGHLLMEKYPELDGKNLGNWIRRFKELINEGGETFDEYVLKRTQEEIMEYFESFYHLKL